MWNRKCWSLLDYISDLDAFGVLYVVAKSIRLVERNLVAFWPSIQLDGSSSSGGTKAKPQQLIHTHTHTNRTYIYGIWAIVHTQGTSSVIYDYFYVQLRLNWCCVVWCGGCLHENKNKNKTPTNTLPFFIRYTIESLISSQSTIKREYK